MAVRRDLRHGGRTYRAYDFDAFGFVIDGAHVVARGDLRTQCGGDGIESPAPDGASFADRHFADVGLWCFAH